MKRRIQVNTKDLAIGDVFYIDKQGKFANHVVSQGPKFCGYVTAITKLGRLYKHYYVWIDAPPRNTVGEFEVGEKITGVNGKSEIYQINAVGEEHSLARLIDNCNEHKCRETLLHHSWSAMQILSKNLKEE